MTVLAFRHTFILWLCYLKFVAASFYVYEDENNYKLFYPRNISMDNQVPIESWHIFPRKGVWVVVNIEKRLGTSSVEGSLKILLGGEKDLKRHRDDSLIDINISNIKYFYKNNLLTFHSPEATYEYRVDRYVGEPISKGKFKDFFIPNLDINSATYDPGRNRINLILTSPSSLVQEKVISSPSHVSSA